MAPKRLVGPSKRLAPRLDDERSVRVGDGLEDHDLVEEVDWSDATASGCTGVEMARSVLTRVAFTALELTDLRLLDCVLVDCELSGTVLDGARLERVVFRRCRMAGLVAAKLQGTDVRFEDCKLDQAWLRAATLDRGELVDCELRGADLYEAKITRSAFRRCDLTEVDVSQSRFDQVSLHGSTVDRLKGAEALRGCTIGSDQIVPLALPIFHAQRITVDDDPPELTEG